MFIFCVFVLCSFLPVAVEIWWWTQSETRCRIKQLSWSAWLKCSLLENSWGRKVSRVATPLGVTLIKLLVWIRSQVKRLIPFSNSSSPCLKGADCCVKNLCCQELCFTGHGNFPWDKNSGWFRFIFYGTGVLILQLRAVFSRFHPYPRLYLLTACLSLQIAN